jgi:hypothetical protein
VFQRSACAHGGGTARLAGKIIRRLMGLLTRRGALIEEQGVRTLAASEVDPALAPLQVASCTAPLRSRPARGAQGAELSEHLPSQ